MKRIEQFHLVNVAFLLFGIFGFRGQLLAQSISPESVNSGGTSMYQSNGSVSFVVGETVVLVMIDSLGNSLGGGFTNTSVITTTVLSSEYFFPEKIKISVYPNPANDFIMIKIEDSKIDFVKVRIFNSNGQVVYFGEYATLSRSIMINMSPYSSGNYQIEITDKEGISLGFHKIIRQ